MAGPRSDFTLSLIAGKGAASQHARAVRRRSAAAHGLRGREIAKQLVVSPSTIKTHFNHAYEKLGVADRAAAVATALRLG